MDEDDEQARGSAPASAPPEPDDTDPERRAILAALGKIAALTPPAVLTLLMSTRHAAAS